MKIRSVGAELFHADRQADIMKLIVAFRNLANAPKNSQDNIFFFHGYVEWTKGTGLRIVKYAGHP
jgi:hypothetical protein